MPDIAFVTYEAPVRGPDGALYRATVFGREMPDGMWEGWIEFVSEAGGEPISGGRETTQPNREAVGYWAGGLSEVFLQGALKRALGEPPHAAEPTETVFVTVEPRAEHVRPPVLDPFAVYAKSGEERLRRELHALADWRLRDIARAFALAPEDELIRLDRAALAERVVAGVIRDRAPVRA